MLMFVDDQLRTQEAHDSLKRALLSSGLMSLDELYPVEGGSGADVDLNDSEKSYDFSQVHYDPPSADDMADFYRMMGQIEDTHVIVPEAPPESGEEDGEWT